MLAVLNSGEVPSWQQCPGWTQVLGEADVICKLSKHWSRGKATRLQLETDQTAAESSLIHQTCSVVALTTNQPCLLIKRLILINWESQGDDHTATTEHSNTMDTSLCVNCWCYSTKNQQLDRKRPAGNKGGHAYMLASWVGRQWCSLPQQLQSQGRWPLSEEWQRCSGQQHEEQQMMEALRARSSYPGSLHL